MRKFNKTFSNNTNESDTWIPSFLKKYTPDFVSSSHEIPSDVNVKSSNSFLTSAFRINELISAIATRKDTVFGLDGMPYSLFKKLSNKNLEIFLKILNLLWENNTIPKDWKKDCLIPILKPDKIKFSPDSYRPIALTSCVGKLFE